MAKRVVALGGGHGLAVALRAVRKIADEITAIVTIADDGGSSGLLRETIHIAPPGDARRCFGALLSDDSMWPSLLEHRFTEGPFAGHPVGNAVLAALLQANPSATAAFEQAATLFEIPHRVLPASSIPVTLVAETSTKRILGQLEIATCTEPIHTLSILEEGASSPREAVEAIAQADHILIGPGSLFTSILPVLVMPDISAALRSATADIDIILNAKAEFETAGLSGDAHMDILRAHGCIPDRVLVDSGGSLNLSSNDVQVSVIQTYDGTQHDPQLLASALEEIWS